MLSWVRERITDARFRYLFLHESEPNYWLAYGGKIEASRLHYTQWKPVYRARRYPSELGYFKWLRLYVTWCA